MQQCLEQLLQHCPLLTVQVDLAVDGFKDGDYLVLPPSVDGDGSSRLSIAAVFELNFPSKAEMALTAAIYRWLDLRKLSCRPPFLASSHRNHADGRTLPFARQQLQSDVQRHQQSTVMHRRRQQIRAPTVLPSSPRGRR